MLVDAPPRARATAAIVASVSPDRPKPRDPRLAIARSRRAGPLGARSTCRQGRRDARRAAAPARPTKPLMPTPRRRHSSARTRSPAQRPRRSPASSSRPRPARLALARDEHRQRAAALGRHVVELEVLDVDPLGAERLEDPGEHARPVGDVDPEPVESPGSANAVAASPGGARSPRRSIGRGSPRRLRRAPARPARAARRCSASAAASASRLSRKMSTRSGGWRRRSASCPAASRPPPASGSCPSILDDPAWFSMTSASTCGSRPVTRHQAVVGVPAPMATGWAPSAVDEARARREVFGRGRRRRGHEPGRTVEEFRARAVGPRVSAPQSGDPRRSAGRRPQPRRRAPSSSRRP